MNAKIIAIAMQKGGTAKTTTSVSLGVGLAKENKKVLLIDADSQGSMSVSLGIEQPDDLETSLATLLSKIVTDNEIGKREGIIPCENGVDLIAGNLDLSLLEVSLVNTMSRETILRRYLENQRSNYDYIIIDCPPSLGMITINALASADSVIIPVQAQYLPAKGIAQLLPIIAMVKKQINSKITIDGICITMADTRTNLAKDISKAIADIYGKKLHIFATAIPYSIRASEATTIGKSIFEHDPKGKVAKAYENLTKEVINIEKQKQQKREKIGWER